MDTVQDKIKLMCNIKGNYVAVLQDGYRLDGTAVIEGESKQDVYAQVARADRWVTINGAHVLLGKNNTIVAGMGGKFNGFHFGANFSDKGKKLKDGRGAARLYIGGKANVQTGRHKMSARQVKINNVISSLNIQVRKQNGEEKLWCNVPKYKKALFEKNVEFIRQNRKEIIEQIKSQKKTRENEYKLHKVRLKAMEGYEEIKSAKRIWDKYRRDFDKAVENGTGILPKKPQIETVGVLMKKHPRAAAYIKMSSWQDSSNYVKSGIGEKAAKEILRGGNYAQVLARAEQEWSKYATKAVMEN